MALVAMPDEILETLFRINENIIRKIT